MSYCDAIALIKWIDRRCIISIETRRKCIFLKQLYGFSSSEIKTRKCEFDTMSAIAHFISLTLKIVL